MLTIGVRPKAMMTGSFASFFLGGFECSCHKRRDGRRLDLLRSTGHDETALADFRALQEHGIATVRDGLRWHLIEGRAGIYDWESFLPIARAARQTGTQVIWDLCHYGWPDHLDIWSPWFPDRFARFARAAALAIADASGAPPLVCPVNEISFWAWAGAEIGRFAPCETRRGGELKRQLVRACIAATEAVRAVVPDARFICAEPAIHIDPGIAPSPERWAATERNRLAQFEAIDLLTGRQEPELGGRPDYLDILGINFYPDNQWYYGDLTIPLGHHAFRPFSRMLDEWSRRYGRPILIAETGSEGSARASWLHYVCGEVQEAKTSGIPVEGICIYPILEYSGWENDRNCATGLLTRADASGHRHVHGKLASELRLQRALLSEWDNRGQADRAVRLSEAA